MTVVEESAARGLHSLEGLAQELARQQESKYDVVIDTRKIDWYTHPEAGTLVQVGTDRTPPLVPVGDGFRPGWQPTAHGHGQVASRLKIPKPYYERLRAEAPALLDENVRWWFRERPEKRMLRFLDGGLRAYVSNRFRRLDNYDLMERSILPAFQDVEGIEFNVASLTPDRMFVRALLPRLTGEVRVGDVVQAGVQIRNSEVGAGRLAVEPLLWRLVCMNGMVVPDRAFQAYHLGRRVDESEDSYEIYRADTMAADDKAFFLKARDAVRAALSEVRFRQIIADLQEAATSGPEIASMVSATEVLQQTYGLQDEEREGILTQLAMGADLSRWGLANAVTATAKSAETFDRQEELERLGWEVATMEPAKWQAVAVPS